MPLENAVANVAAAPITREQLVE
ncbi:hypothetical protein, partial [Pseudomonas soli]